MKALWIYFPLVLTGCFIKAIRAEACSVTDGSCNWTDEISCQQPEKYCGSCSQCFVITKSSNSSYPVNATYSTLLAMCRCNSQASQKFASTGKNPRYAIQTGCSHNEEIIQTSGNSTDHNYIEVIHARMWSTMDGLAPDCDNYDSFYQYKYLPNALAIVRFWCQNREQCTFNTTKILSYVGFSQSLRRRFSFEWSYAKAYNESKVTAKCELNNYYHEATRSCYSLTAMTNDWNKSRAECLRQGGDLAHFSEQINFMDILRHFNPFIGNITSQASAIKAWFKWYSWDGEQRKVQDFREAAEKFACEIYDNGPIPAFARCYSLPARTKAQGFCVLPPVSPDFKLAEYQVLKCPAKTVPVNGYPTNWNATDAGVTAQLACPAELIGTMYWKCGSDGNWETPTPDSSGCSNPLVTESVNNANEQLNIGTDPAEALANLGKDISSTTLASGNLGALDNTMKLAISKQEELLANITNPNVRESSSKNFTVSITDLSDVIMSNSDAFWGLDVDERLSNIDNVQKNIDISLSIMAINLVNNPTYQLTDETVAVQAQSRRRTDYNDSGYTLSVNDVDRIILPPGFQYLVDEVYGKVQLSHVVYTEFPRLLHGDSFALFEEEWLASENDSENRPATLKDVVNTFVLGVTLGEGNMSLPLEANITDTEKCTFDTESFVEVRLKTLQADRYQSSGRRCVFWDVALQSWSDEGCCLVPQSDETVTTCRCNHLTNFAVIMDINGIFANKTAPALDYITVIGESISIVCLGLAVFIFFWVRTLRREFRFRIHRNLCLSLLIAETLLLFGLDATYNSGLCTAIAVFLHLFFLCAFGWMFVEGLFLYFLITKVFNGSGLKHWHYFAIGYGLPILIVAITLAATQLEAYNAIGSTCWLNVQNGGIWAFAGPVAAVVVANLGFLTIALITTVRIRQNRAETTQSSVSGKRQIFGAFTLTFILGITWIFGFLYFNELGIAFAYIFTILNSVQGLVIFLALCVFNKQVRNDFVRQLVSTEIVQRLGRCFNIDTMEWHSQVNRSTQQVNLRSLSHPQPLTSERIHSSVSKLTGSKVILTSCRTILDDQECQTNPDSSVHFRSLTSNNVQSSVSRLTGGRVILMAYQSLADDREYRND